MYIFGNLSGIYSNNFYTRSPQKNKPVKIANLTFSDGKIIPE